MKKVCFVNQCVRCVGGFFHHIFVNFIVYCLSSHLLRSFAVSHTSSWIMASSVIYKTHIRRKIRTIVTCRVARETKFACIAFYAYRATEKHFKFRCNLVVLAVKLAICELQKLILVHCFWPHLDGNSVRIVNCWSLNEKTCTVDVYPCRFSNVSTSFSIVHAPSKCFSLFFCSTTKEQSVALGWWREAPP